MQSNDIKAFRQRLVRAQFTDISIYDNGYGFYTVYCISPKGEKIQRRMSITEIRNTPRIVWFD